MITALFFTQCGFKMDESDESFIDCKIMRTKAGYRARGDCRLSKSVGAQAAHQETWLSFEIRREFVGKKAWSI